MITSRSVYAFYENQPISILIVEGTFQISDINGKPLSTRLLPEVEALILLAESAAAQAQAEIKASERAALAASFGEAIALRLLPDSLYTVSSLVTLAEYGNVFGFMVGTVNSADLRSAIQALTEKDGGNHNGQSITV